MSALLSAATLCQPLKTEENEMRKKSHISLAGYLIGELEAPTDRSRSDCVHEQVAKRIANVRFTKKPITVKSASANRNASSIITIKDTFYITFNHASP